MVIPACYPGGGGGTDPPTTTFYFPVGLAVSSGGNALYVVNSDFDLQWNGGTLQSYDLFSIRADTARLIKVNLSQQAPITLAQDPTDPIKFFFPPSTQPCAIGTGLAADAGTPTQLEPNGNRVGLGEACAPPIDTSKYVRSSVVIGAFATQLQLQTGTPFTVPFTMTAAGPVVASGAAKIANAAEGVVGRRLFTPVRGNATLTWADVAADDATSVPTWQVNGQPVLNDAGKPTVPDAWAVPTTPILPTQTQNLSGNPVVTNSIFVLGCGAPSSGTPTCDAEHTTGNNALAPGNTRELTMPGEPFGMALTPDGTAVAITHQTETDTSLLLAGSPDPMPPTVPVAVDPTMQFVVDNVSNGGKGIAAIPHDIDAPVPPCEAVDDVQPCVRPAFLQTNNTVAQLDLVRYYDDDYAMIGNVPDGGSVSAGGNVYSGGSLTQFASSLRRPYLVKEASFPFSTNLAGTDSRGIVVDPTLRMACKATGLLPASVCAQYPARVFFANRSPPSLVIASIGGTSVTSGGTYNPDLVTFATSSIPLPAGPSSVYLAPIVNLEHNYELRVFVVNFDSATISIYDPNKPNELALVDTIYVGPGPFAMAFDPFSLEDVATNAAVPTDGRYDPSLKLTRTYRFAYVASFTQSYVQVIDLDQSQPTYESVVYTLGNPTAPKGS